ncbi:hypothetical protein P2T68_16860 [Pseudomonas sp. G11]|uniref:hypothetical protein n=1 Tax=Pseudomonas sp. G11 TaxID=528343 RepID=UPI00240264E6|nr:hypothetical protein [Pseudomonas sp. G11]WEX18915.1 hypothetical protein P2T68_16860 [Pseudomonas sp. G11]
MTTNQTIDGVLVPRELARRLAVPMLRTPEYLFDHRDALDELRALLDAKSCGKCSKPTACGKMLCEDCCYETPAARPQENDQGGFWQWLDSAYRDGSKGEEPRFTKYNMEVAYHAGANAEQPAPVAVAEPRTPFEIKHDAEPGEEAAFRKWRQERIDATKKDPRTAMGV